MKIDLETYEEIRDEWFRLSSTVRSGIAIARFFEIALEKKALEEELQRPAREAVAVLYEKFSKDCAAAGIEVLDEEDGASPGGGAVS